MVNTLTNSVNKKIYLKNGKFIKKMVADGPEAMLDFL